MRHLYLMIFISLSQLIILLTAPVNAQDSSTKAPASQPSIKHQKALKWLLSSQDTPAQDLVPELVLLFSQLKTYENPDYTPYILGLLSTLFREHPSQLPNWYPQFAELPLNHKRIVIAAIWISNTKESRQFLQSLAKTEEEVLAKAIQSTLKQTPPDLSKSQMNNYRSLGLMWGIFLANGDTQAVQTVVNSLALLKEKTRLNSMQTGTRAKSDLIEYALKNKKVEALLLANQNNEDPEINRQINDILRQIKIRRAPRIITTQPAD